MKKILLVLMAGAFLASCGETPEKQRQHADFDMKCAAKGGKSMKLKKGAKGGRHWFCVMPVEPYGDYFD